MQGKIPVYCTISSFLNSLFFRHLSTGIALSLSASAIPLAEQDPQIIFVWFLLRKFRAPACPGFEVSGMGITADFPQGVLLCRKVPIYFQREQGREGRCGLHIDLWG